MTSSSQSGVLPSDSTEQTASNGQASWSPALRSLELWPFANWPRALWIVLAVAMIVRVGTAVEVERRVKQTPGQLCLIPGDADGYWELAQRIVKGRDYSLYDPPRFVLRMPGFPVLLALCQLLFGDGQVFPTRIVLAGVGTMACGLTYWLGRLLFDSTTGLLAALYVAVSPTQALFSVLLLSESAFSVTLLLSLIAIACTIPRNEEHTFGKGSGRGTRFSGITFLGMACGVTIGMATFMRPTWLYVGPMIAVVVTGSMFPRSSWKSLLSCWGTLLVGLSVTLAPWIIRNVVVTGHAVPTTLWVGPSLYDGLNPTAKGDSNMQFVEDDQLMDRMSEYEMDREYRRRALAFAARNPGTAMWLAVEKQKRYWSFVPNAAQFSHPVLATGLIGATLPLFALAFVGAWQCRTNLPALAITTGPILLFAGLHLLFVGSLRYRLPAEFPLAALAAFGAKAMFAKPPTIHPTKQH